MENGSSRLLPWKRRHRGPGRGSDVQTSPGNFSDTGDSFHTCHRNQNTRFLSAEHHTGPDTETDTDAAVTMETTTRC